VASSGAVLENVSGNNTFAANVSINGTGGNGAIIQSDSGLLSVSGNLQSFDNARGYVFQGAGDISVTGNLLAGTSTVNAKSGAGTLTLSGTNTAAGFAISGGKVVTANTSALGASPVTVTGTGNLTVGDGTVDTIGGLKGLTMSAGTTLAFTGTDSQIQLAGGLFQLNGITLDLNNQFNTPGTYTLIDSVITNSNNTIGTYNVVNGNPGYTYTFSVVGSQDAVLNVAAAVPEPGSLALLGLGGLLALRRRRSV
ncbi:MAG: PEP-CTERM sorting domain-containing protein, partial [Tepidisphaeraceae bacterium]